MKSLALALPLLAIAAGAQEPPASAAEGKHAKPQPSLSMSDPAIQKAVRDVLAEDGSDAPRADGQVLRADPAYRAFARKMDEAKVPDCLHADALKHQPPMIGPIPVVGLFVLPFWAAAAVRGKCR